MSTPLVLEFTVSGPPVPKARARVVQCGEVSRAYTPPKTKQYEAAVRTHARVALAHYRRRCGQPWPIDAQSYRLTCVFHREANRGDLDNYIKAVKDALNPPRGRARAAQTIVWPDDARVTSYGPMSMDVDRERPSTWVRIEAML